MKSKIIYTIAFNLIGTNILFPTSNIIFKSYTNSTKSLVALESKPPVPNVIGSNNITSILGMEFNDPIDYLKETTYIDENGQVIVKNTADILVLANKERSLPSSYIPKDLVIPNVNFPFKEDLDKKYLRKEAAIALEELFEGGQAEDIILYAISGYRSYARQKTLFDNKARNVGPEAANLLVAKPGQSEHQTGLVMDVSSREAGFSLEESFGETTEGKWLKNNAHKYGFIIRYQEETTDITGYSYEPWHIRYVGKEVSEKIYEQNITLEEFLGAI